jgi:hypothetical protein
LSNAFVRRGGSTLGFGLVKDKALVSEETIVSSIGKDLSRPRLIPTDMSTVFTAMKKCLDVSMDAGQEHAIQTFDQQIYALAQQVKWSRPDIFRFSDNKQWNSVQKGIVWVMLLVCMGNWMTSLDKSLVMIYSGAYALVLNI